MYCGEKIMHFGISARRLTVRACIVVALAMIGPRAFACPDGQYNACVFGACACVPNGRTVVTAVNPIPDVLNIASGVVHGNIHAVSQGIGGILVKATCEGCAIAAQTVLSSNDKATVEEVIGRGWLVYLTTGSPSLVIADAATSVVKEYDLNHPGPNILAPQPPAARQSQHYKVDGALCAVKSEGRDVAAGWVSAPIFVNDAGQSFTFPGVDLVEGDSLDIQANNTGCKAPPQGQSLLDHVHMIFEYPQVPPTVSPTAMKYFL
jgi:hypothetical protein